MKSIFNLLFQGFSLKANSVTTGKEVPEIKCSDQNLHIPEAELAAVMCTKTTKEQYACRILVNGADDAIHLLQQGGMILQLYSMYLYILVIV